MTTWLLAAKCVASTGFLLGGLALLVFLARTKSHTTRKFIVAGLLALGAAAGLLAVSPQPTPPVDPCSICWWCIECWLLP